MLSSPRLASVADIILQIVDVGEAPSGFGVITDAIGVWLHKALGPCLSVPEIPLHSPIRPLQLKITPKLGSCPSQALF